MFQASPVDAFKRDANMVRVTALRTA